MEEVSKRAVQAARKGKIFCFHWRGGSLTRETLKEILTVLERAAEEREKHARVRLNWPQAVLSVSFEERLPELACTVQEANEGEMDGERN